MLNSHPAGRRLLLEGVVQGVGFRPHAWRLAREHDLRGWVRNIDGAVEIVVEGGEEAVGRFCRDLVERAPPLARIDRVETSGRAATGATTFEVDASMGTEAGGSRRRLVAPDAATCPDCLHELRDPADRRHRYPFVNCTNCGPRFTIIDDLPYDRSRTSMQEFALCEACSAEYGDPGDRRFHAEPVACSACGPRLRLVTTDGAGIEGDPIMSAVALLRSGGIVAVKGLGGYQLACDATDETAVAELRRRKHRPHKPFAVMVADLAAARQVAAGLGSQERALLTSPAAPIVLVRARRPAGLAPSIAPGHEHVGVLFPTTPLHHLLLGELGRPLVMTSGNRSDEPIAIDDSDALRRLGDIADAFVAHDRRIRARYDDSVTRAIAVDGDVRESVIRRGRGYAPDPLDLPVATPAPILAVGAELKHTFTLARRARAHVAPHTGDLEDLLVHRAFEENLAHLARLLDRAPEWVAHDLPPAYLSTQYAVDRFPADRRIAVQHHHAHVSSAAAEPGFAAPFIGVAYDGLGMGDDGTFWGGEILVADLVGYRRVARFGLAPMPGGALAVRKPYRMALGYLLGAEDLPGGSAVPPELAAAFLDRLDPREVGIVRVQVARGLNAPVASSAGRLFDAVSSLIGLRDVAEYEAQAAIDLENVATDGPAAPLPYRIVRHDGLLVYDPRPTIVGLLEAHAGGEAAATLAARFHETVAAVTIEIVADVAARAGLDAVALSGGVFQNQRLVESLAARLTADGFRVLLNERVPANDGGISYGQAAVAAARLSADGDTSPSRSASGASPERRD